MRVFLLLCLAGVVAAQQRGLNHSQLEGLKKLLKNLDAGVYPTCKLVLFSELVDFNTAEERCKNFDIGMGGNQQGNLATVNDEEKNTDLKLLLKMAYPKQGKKWDDEEWVWAGMRKTRNNEGKKKGKKYNALDWQWADGSHPNEYHMWMKKQPDQNTEKDENGNKLTQNQMRINKAGLWDDTYAYQTHPYACDYQGKYILSASQKTWSQAKVACEEAGLHLAKVRSDAEVEEITLAMDYFLGARDESVKLWDAENWIWLGGNDEEEEGVWKWVDGSAMEYFEGMNWRRPNPDNAGFIRKTTQNVLSLSRDGEFDDSYDHRKRQRAFACQCPGT